MKVINSILFLISLILLTSCGGGGSSSDIINFGEALKSEFGADAYYTSISFTDTHIRAVGNVMTAEVTNDPSSNKMEDWTALRGAWEKKGNVILEISGGAKAEQFMFQLGKRVKINVLDSLFTDAQARLKKEKDIDSRIKLVNVTAPKNGDLDNMKYSIAIEPETGGTTFNFSYKLNGDFVNMHAIN